MTLIDNVANTSFGYVYTMRLTTAEAYVIESICDRHEAEEDGEEIKDMLVYTSEEAFLGIPLFTDEDADIQELYITSTEYKVMCDILQRHNPPEDMITFTDKVANDKELYYIMHINQHYHTYKHQGVNNKGE